MRTVAFVLFMALLAATAVSALRTEVRLREPTAEMELVDESSFVEQTPVAAPAPLVPAEPVSVPANTTKPAANLKKPIIFLNRTHTPKDPSEPLTGPVPKKLKKAASPRTSMEVLYTGRRAAIGTAALASDRCPRSTVMMRSTSLKR